MEEVTTVFCFLNFMTFKEENTTNILMRKRILIATFNFTDQIHINRVRLPHESHEEKSTLYKACIGL